nr:hypothetical protein [Pantoea stewartii]
MKNGLELEAPDNPEITEALAFAISLISIAIFIWAIRWW